MKVYVIMGNAYPEAVFMTEEAAEAFCEVKKLDGLGKAPRIYWRVYEFELQGATQ